MSKKIERINQLIAIIKEKNGASVKELAQMLGVSEMTIRRDLQILNSNHIVNNVYGAAIYNPSNTVDNLDKNYSLLRAKVKKNTEKGRIGKYAASIIEENDVIIIDSGSTTEQLAMNISDHVKATVLCYNYNILSNINDKENIKIIFAGGYFHPDTQMFESPEGISLINNIRATKSFVSAAGIHQTLGVTCANNYEAPTKNAIIASSAEKILLADSSKFSQVKSSYFADLKEFHTIISDTNLDSEWVDYINTLGIKLILV